MDVLDDYLVNPQISVLEKTRIQAQVLVPVLRAMRAEFGKAKADALVKDALQAWSRQLFAEIAKGIEGSGRRKWAVLQGSFNDVTQQEVDFEVVRRDGEALHIDVTRCDSPSSSARWTNPNLVRCWCAPPMPTSPPRRAMRSFWIASKP